MDRCGGASPWLRLLLLAAVRGAHGDLPPPRDRTCLRVNGTIPPQNRSYVTLDGQQTALGILSLDWDSATLERWLYRIIVEEVLGVNAVFTDSFSTSAPAFYAVAGCKDPMNYVQDPKCGPISFVRNHVVLGLWDNFAELAYADVEDNFPELFPLAYGAFEYAGRDSIFAPEASMAPALAEEHLPLEYYKSYSHPSINVSKYFASPWSIDGSRLYRCENTTLAYNDQIEIYLKLTQNLGIEDLDGVVITDMPDGSKNHVAKCYRDSWWLAPACRDDPDTCIPFITGGNGWYVDVMMQKSAAWNMPIAIAVAVSFDEYVALPLEYPVIFYWWWPDSSFLTISPVELIWQPHNSLEWRQNNKRTDSKDIQISKFAFNGLRNRSNTGFQKPLAVLEKMTLAKEDIGALMIEFVKMGSSEAAAEQLACEWLNNHTDRWEKEWIPMETACLEGQGLINAAGSFVPLRAEAKECQWCATGWKSVPLTDPEGPTYICEQCDAGYFQEQLGETECLACPIGRSAEVKGSETCSACAVGRYAGQTAQSACISCAFGFVTEFPGADSETSCVCSEDFYRDAVTRACVECPNGMDCPRGSDELAYDTNQSLDTKRIVPLLQPGYWSSPSNPLSVYTCENSIRCPGGRPGESCAERLVGQACGHCRTAGGPPWERRSDSWRWNGEQCRECHAPFVTALLFPVLPLIAGPIIVIMLYTVSADHYRNWGSWQNGAAAAAFIVLNHYQVLAIVRGTNIVFPGSLANVFEFFTVTTDIMAYFDAGCAGIGDFLSLLLLRSLAPAFICVMYLLVYSGSLMAARWDPNLKMDVNRTLNGFFSIMFTFFAGIASMAFTMFKCGPNPNGSSSLIADRSVTCHVTEWNNMVVIGVLAVLCWCVGFGAIFCRSIWRAPKEFHEEKMQMCWKFLFIRYRPDVHWWALVFVVKGVALNVGFLFMGDGVSQLWWILYVLTAYTGLTCVFRPWRHMVVNIVDVWAHLCLALASAGLTWFAHKDNSQDAMMNTMCQVLIVSIFPPACFCVIHMIWQQSSAASIARKKVDMELIADAFDTFTQASEEEQHRFLDTLSEWDFWFLSMTSGIVHTELALRKCRGGYSIQKMQGSIVSTNEQIQQLRESRRSRMPRQAAQVSEVLQQGGVLHKMWV